MSDDLVDGRHDDRGLLSHLLHVELCGDGSRIDGQQDRAIYLERGEKRGFSAMRREWFPMMVSHEWFPIMMSHE